MYSLGFAFAAAVSVKGFDYYILPLTERPHSELHRAFKPGGEWGHGLGILGSSMLLLLFLYSARKRNLLGLRFWKIRYWLNFHIFLGIMGPVFVTLHTALKFGGFVSVSYFSMMAVMLSGFVGRYLYVQIPRALSGDKLSMKQMEERNEQLTRLLVEKYRVNPKAISKLHILAGVHEGKELTGVAAIFTIIKNDLTRPSKFRGLRKKLLLQNGDLPPARIHDLFQLINQKALLIRKMALLSSIQPLFHYWHVAHKPFAYVMIIIMVLHVGITILFGFRWIF